MKINFERTIASVYYYKSSSGTYQVEFKETPFTSANTYDFVWSATRYKQEIEYIIKEWNEPLYDEKLGLMVCLKFSLANSPRVWLNSYLVTVTMRYNNVDNRFDDDILVLPDFSDLTKGNA